MFSRMILWIVYLDVMKRTQTSDTTNCGLGFTLRLRLDGDALGSNMTAFPSQAVHCTTQASTAEK